MENEYTTHPAPDWEQRKFEFMKAVLPLTLRNAIERNNQWVVTASREGVEDAYHIAQMAVDKLKGGEQ